MRHLLLLALVACGSTGQTLVPDVPGAPDSAPEADGPPATTYDPATDGDAEVAESGVAIPGALASHTLQATLFAPSTASLGSAGKVLTQGAAQAIKGSILRAPGTSLLPKTNS